MPATAAESHRPDGSCPCATCAGRREFELPEQLVDAFLAGDLVVFAGAGVSTESRSVFPYTLYEEIARRLPDEPAEDPSFPAVMSAYELRFGRADLLQTIKKRLDYVRSFPKLNAEASAFHRELATAFTVTEIVTTNWDTYFEDCCGATPFLTEADWAFWKSSDRKVFKLHGSITSPGSVIATEADYERCQRELNEGLVGAHLKTMLATKTVVFIGYSFRDSDLAAIYSALKERMQEMLPRAYIVTLDEGEPEDIARELHVIRTDATYFMERLKERYPEDEFIPDDRFEAVPFVQAVVTDLHIEMVNGAEMRENPALLLAACYHDGLLDAFDHQQANLKRGEYSHRCHVERLVERYDEIQKEKLEAGRYHDVAYVEGYLNGLLFALIPDEERKNLPLYYVAGYDGDLRSPEEFAEAAARAEELDPEAFAAAAQLAARLEPDVVFQHTPFLL